MDSRDEYLDSKLDQVITQLARLEVYIATHKELIDKVGSKLDKIDEVQKVVNKHDIMLRVIYSLMYSCLKSVKSYNALAKLQAPKLLQNSNKVSSSRVSLFTMLTFALVKLLSNIHSILCIISCSFL